MTKPNLTYVPQFFDYFNDLHQAYLKGEHPEPVIVHSKQSLAQSATHIDCGSIHYYLGDFSSTNDTMLDGDEHGDNYTFIRIDASQRAKLLNLGKTMALLPLESVVVDPVKLRPFVDLTKIISGGLVSSLSKYKISLIRPDAGFCINVLCDVDLDYTCDHIHSNAISEVKLTQDRSNPEENWVYRFGDPALSIDPNYGEDEPELARLKI